MIRKRIEIAHNANCTIKAKVSFRSLLFRLLRRELGVGLAIKRMIFYFDFIGDLVGKVSTLKRKLHTKSKQRQKEWKTSM